MSGRNMAGGLMVGCCGFPMARSSYFASFPIVEVQQTFYQPPRRETLLRWRSEAPPDFVFTLKAWQLITHEPSSPTYRRLKNPVPEGKRGNYGSFRQTDEVLAAWEATLEAARALQAAVIVFQSPASFTPTPEHERNLRAFFARARQESGSILLGWEPRRTWQRDIAAELCHELGLILVVDPFITPPPETGPRYFRLHGIGGYRYRYTDDELRQLANWCRGTTCCLFNNVYMAEDAKRFLTMIGEPR